MPNFSNFENKLNKDIHGFMQNPFNENDIANDDIKKLIEENKKIKKELIDIKSKKISSSNNIGKNNISDKRYKEISREDIYIALETIRNVSKYFEEEKANGAEVVINALKNTLEMK